MRSCRSRGSESERAHVVQPVGQLHDDDANIVDHGEQHLAELSACRSSARRIELAQLGDAIHAARPLLRRNFCGSGRACRRCLPPRRAAGRSRRQTCPCCMSAEMRGHQQRVDHVGLAGVALLALVTSGGEAERPFRCGAMSSVGRSSCKRASELAESAARRDLQRESEPPYGPHRTASASDNMDNYQCIVRTIPIVQKPKGRKARAMGRMQAYFAGSADDAAGGGLPRLLRLLGVERLLHPTVGDFDLLLVLVRRVQPDRPARESAGSCRPSRHRIPCRYRAPSADSQCLHRSIAQYFACSSSLHLLVLDRARIFRLHVKVDARASAAPDTTSTHAITPRL